MILLNLVCCLTASELSDLKIVREVWKKNNPERDDIDCNVVGNRKIDPNGFIHLILRLVMLLSSRKGLFMADNKIEKLGHIVRQARKEQGLTQEQLAATTGVGVRFIRELEQGKESCYIGKALTIVSMLGIDITIGGEVL